MLRHACACAVLLAPLAPLNAHAALSAPEQIIVSTVNEDHHRSVALLENLVNQNSGSMNLEGVTRVGQFLRPEFEALGFTVQWKPMASAQRAGHLIATHTGKPNGKRMLLIGHLDTVFEADAPFQTYSAQGNTATGPGVGDNKGGLVVMLGALRAMQAAGTLKDANIEVVLTGDEEHVGTPQDIARADLIAAGKRADVALDFENLAQEGGQDMGSIARRSSNSWTLKTTGKSGHSSGIFSAEAGDGALYELARILTAFRQELPEPNLTFNVGLVGGGQTAEVDTDGVRIAATGKTNIIPSVAVAKGDFRTLSQEQTSRVREKMQAIVARHLPITQASISFEQGYPAMPPTAGSRAYLAQLNAVNSDLGLPQMAELDPLKRGAGDIAFVADDVDGLVGLGIAGAGSHAPGETADLASLDRQAIRAAILMSRLGAQAR